MAGRRRPGSTGGGELVIPETATWYLIGDLVIPEQRMTIGILLCAMQLATPTQSSEWVEFIGFSEDGRLAAYRRDIRRPRADGTLDAYSLIHTLDVATGAEVATFKATAIQRVLPDGKAVRTPKRELLADNPAFRDAYPNKRWLKLKKRSAFANVPLTIGGEVVLTVDEDVQVNEATKEDGHYVATNSGALGFRLSATLDGVQSDLGHYRHASGNNAGTIARLQAFSSKSRDSVAFLAIFMLTEGDTKRSVSSIKVARSDAGEKTDQHP